MTKTLALGEILTTEEMNRAIEIYNKLGDSEKHRFAEQCAAEVIRPIIDRINKITTQENDPKYLAYCIEYALMKARGNLHG